MAEKSNVDDGQFVSIELVDLNVFITDLGRNVDVLKMDVEGAEIDILDAMLRDGTHEKIDLMLVETHERKIPSHRARVRELHDRIKDEHLHKIKPNWI